MPTFGGIVIATGGGQSTGRRTFLDIVDELARPVNVADPTVRALAADAFRSAVRTMNRKGMWPWELLDEDITLTADNVFATVSGPIKKPLAMHYLNAAGGTRNQQIDYMSYDRFIELDSMDITGEPSIYTIPNMYETGQIRFFPIPAAAYNVRLTYYRVTPAPKNEQEVVEIPDYVTDVYMKFAELEFLKRLPSEQRPFPINAAFTEARRAFREISHHVNSPGDRSRWVH